VADVASDNGRMNFETLRKFHHGKRRGVVFHPAGLPDRVWNEPVLDPFVGLILLWIATNA
jgi:hypothetical protein